MADPATAAVLQDAVVRHPARAIGPLDLSIASGEIVALVGASGAGKSTALRLLSGLEHPTEGRVAIATEAARPGGTAFVFQSATLMPWADALTNVALPLDLTGVAGPEARRRATEALSAVGLGDRLDAKPFQLSGGMAMRVSLARALVTRPRLLLLDEPFAALDSITRRGLIEDLHRLWTDTLPAIVFVTHDVDEAVYLAQRVVVLDAATGSVAAILQTHGALPRPVGWRADAAYRQSVEAVGDALSLAMEPAAA